MSLLAKLVNVPRTVNACNSLCSILKTLKLYTPLQKINKIFLNVVMGIKYGKDFRTHQIGTISAHGVTFKMYDPSRWYLSEALAGRDYEPSVATHLTSLLTDRKCCFVDVGSSFGYYTLFAGSLNKTCEIHAFEPDTERFYATKQNAIMNQLRVKCHNVALSDETADIPFAVPSMKITPGTKSEIVQAIPFDEVAKKENIHPEIVKIDVHGSEGKVLFGMKRALKNDIKHIYFELHPPELLVGYTLKDCIDLLFKSGFTLYEFNRFRTEKKPDILKMTDELYQNIIDVSKWTDEQVNERRMIYATKVVAQEN